MSGWASTAPAASDALVALAETLDGVDVADGPEIRARSNKRAIVIGDSDDRTDAIEHVLDDGGLEPNQNEHYTVYCRIDVLVGNTRKISAARVDAYGLLADFAGLIYADPSLSGAVMQALIADIRGRAVQTPQGLLFRLRFTVACDAYTGV